MIQIFVYEYQNRKFEIEDFFSDYRLTKIKNITNEKSLKRNIETEHVLFKILKSHNIVKERLDLKVINNKPYLANNNFYYNLSHSKDNLVIALSESEIGIDIQNEISRKTLMRVSKKVFNLDEINHKNLTKIWTIKEAYTKYYGNSIFSNLNELVIDNLKVHNNESYLYYRVFSYLKYYIAVCSKNYEKIVAKKVFFDENNLIKYSNYNIIDESFEEEE